MTIRVSDRAPGMPGRVLDVLRRNSRAIRDALILAGLLRALVYFYVQEIQPWTFPGVDARAYWRIDLAHPYASSSAGEISAYLYSPAFAQLVAPLSLLPFELFFALWAGLSLAILAWLIRPWPAAGLILLLPIVYELCVGNIHFLLAAMVVLGFRLPGVWAFGPITKITPGMGMLWFMMRREWRALAVAAASTGVVVLISVALSPSAWLDWLAFLRSSAGSNDLLVPRVLLGAFVIVIAAVLDRRALVPAGIWIALPIVWINSWVVLLATVPLASDDRSRIRRPMVKLT